MEKISEQQLIQFLEKLVTSIKEGSLSLEELKSISEFYMMYTFSDIKNDVSEKDLLKFLSLGWYIYKNISDCSEP